jgi:hypothetical protein
MTEEEHELLTYEEAIALLPETEKIHTIKQAAPSLNIGCDMKYADALDMIKKHGALRAGENAQKIGHGLYCNGYFIETNEE